MSRQFNPGDPVLIVGCYVEGAANIGKCAEVAEVIEPEDGDEGLRFRVVCDGMVYVELGRCMTVVGHLWMAAEHLMPLRGSRAEQYEYFRETIKVGAA
ncbi:hypothetical protein [Stutzerimonas nitrititolerans]|uniref:hypothetical protein n=1 Tax=Stutzerimonas nitrititolerans TaxID=2482751 RepID=UPI0028AE914F|nr:hypothetical protein [Stutzerimonas nitrititolerans]